jgi:hypothetical protein
MVSWTWQTSNDKIQGFRYLWLKTVEGFNPKVHCARCLTGTYSKLFSPRMLVNQTITEDYPEGMLLYFCGVSSPYRWNNNLHLAGKVTPGAVAEVEAYNGDKLIVTGLDAIAINSEPAAALYPTLGKEFLTCRNFQFGAMLIENSDNR